VIGYSADLYSIGGLTIFSILRITFSASLAGYSFSTLLFDYKSYLGPSVWLMIVTVD
jgi:hypothetical protein